MSYGFITTGIGFMETKGMELVLWKQKEMEYVLWNEKSIFDKYENWIVVAWVLNTHTWGLYR